MIEYPTVISPCIAICRLDKKRICIGCSRTAKEIRDWHTLDDAGKAEILKNVEKRK